jgi:hypothetical protein
VKIFKEEGRKTSDLLSERNSQISGRKSVRQNYIIQNTNKNKTK